MSGLPKIEWTFLELRLLDLREHPTMMVFFSLMFTFPLLILLALRYIPKALACFLLFIMFFTFYWNICLWWGLQLVHYHSGGLRINPNLYNCGKVCLSLLGTWSGKGCEKWNPAQSTLLQVLVSIQALILNEKPYYNEPGYEASANTPHGQRNALEYNDNTFLYSCRTMLYSLRRPPEVTHNFTGAAK